MVIVTVDVFPVEFPSLALNVKLSVPLKSAEGVYVTVSSLTVVVPFEASVTILYVTASPSGSVEIRLILTDVSSSVDTV